MLVQDDLLIRQLECELLDRHHLQFALLRRGQQTAVSHILKVFGDLLREYHVGGLGPLQQNMEVITRTTCEAAEHALRWILKHCPVGTHSPGIDWRRKDDEALELLKWAIDYAQLYIDHTAWSRGLMIATIDRDHKFVQFEPTNCDTHFLLNQLEGQQLRIDSFHQSVPATIESELFLPWFLSFRRKDLLDIPPLHLDANSTVYRETEAWANSKILPEIASDRDLGGFSLDEFRRFYVRLWLYCHCVALLETHFDLSFGHEHMFGSRLLQARHTSIRHWISHHCQISETAASHIIDTLSYSCDHRHPSLPGHPFVSTQDGATTLLVRQFDITDPNLMLATALNTGTTKGLYAGLIEEIENAAKSRLAADLRENGYVVWEEPTLQRKDRSALTPDLVVGRAGDDSIAVVEYKHALPPQGAAGVSDRVKETANWIEKARRYLSAAESQTPRLEACLGFDCSPRRRVMVAVLARWPMPIPITIESNRIFFTDVPQAQHQYRSGASVRDTFARSATHAQPRVPCHYHLIQIGEWIYKHPILIFDE